MDARKSRNELCKDQVSRSTSLLLYQRPSSGANGVSGVRDVKNETILRQSSFSTVDMQVDSRVGRRQSCRFRAN